MGIVPPCVMLHFTAWPELALSEAGRDVNENENESEPIPGAVGWDQRTASQDLPSPLLNRNYPTNSLGLSSECWCCFPEHLG